MGTNADTKIDELECRVALQDESIETLSDQIYRQQQQLDAIQSDLDLIKDWIKASLHSQDEQTQTEEPPPPHY